MNAPFTSGEDICKVMAIAADLEWGGGNPRSPTPVKPNPPQAIWRYKCEPSWFGAAVQHAINTFEGAVEWRIEKPGRNWLLRPEVFARLIDEGRLGPDMDENSDDLLELRTVWHQSGDDLPRFLLHVEQILLREKARASCLPIEANPPPHRADPASG